MGKRDSCLALALIAIIKEIKLDFQARLRWDANEILMGRYCWLVGSKIGTKLGKISAPHPYIRPGLCCPKLVQTHYLQRVQKKKILIERGDLNSMHKFPEFFLSILPSIAVGPLIGNFKFQTTI